MDAPVALHEMTFNHRDEFHRKDIAENIIKLLDADVDFCPMVIDGGWGTGKTEFCHKLINLIMEQDTARQASAQPATDTPPAEAGQGGENRPENTPQPERAIIYLDAFASETVDDPLLCILAAIRAEFPEEKKREISRKALPVVKTLGKVAGKALFKYAFKQDIAEVSEDLAEAASDGANALIDQTVDNLLDQYADAQKNLETLQEVLTIAAATRPIIFFIDELDRCRPDFALSILELVKHVFEVPGIKFIFVANMEQLKAVIRKRYGQDVDADVYLEKFVHLSITLPSIHTIDHQLAPYILLEHGLKDTNLLSGDNNFCKKLAKHIILKHHINLRGIEKLIKNINIYKTIYEFSFHSNSIDSFIFLLSMFIFTFNKEVTHKVLNDNIDNGITEFIGESQDIELNNIVFTSNNIIHDGINFSINKYNFSPSDELRIMHTLKDIFNINTNKRPLSIRCHSIKSEFNNYIRRMNMISIKW